MRTRSFLTFVLFVAATISLVTPSAAHHSFAAEYDADRPVTLSVTKMAWINPHPKILLARRKNKQRLRCEIFKEAKHG